VAQDDPVEPGHARRIEAIEAAQVLARSARSGGCRSPSSMRSRTRRCRRISTPTAVQPRRATDQALVEGTPSVAERLMREVLYYVASRQTGDRAGARSSGFPTIWARPSPPRERRPTRSREKPALKSRASTSTHGRTPEQFASGNPPRCSHSATVRPRLEDDAEHLGNGTHGAPREVAEVAAWLTSNRENMSEVSRSKSQPRSLLLENALPRFRASLGDLPRAGAASALALGRLHARQAPAHRAGTPLARRDVAQGAGTACS